MENFLRLIFIYEFIILHFGAVKCKTFERGITMVGRKNPKASIEIEDGLELSNVMSLPKIA